MTTTLWENKHLRIWKTEGVIVGAVIDFTEPDDVDYYLRIGRNKVSRGTMLGNPSFFDKYDTFHGATRYKTLDIKTESGGIVTLENVTVVKKIQNLIHRDNKGSFYMLSPQNGSSGDTMIFAVRTADGEAHDIEGVCSMTEMMQKSIKRQFLLVLGPALISTIFIFSVIFSFFGISVWPFIILFALFFAGVCAAGYYLLGVMIRNSGFPSKAVFKKILRSEGMNLEHLNNDLTKKQIDS